MHIQTHLLAHLIIFATQILPMNYNYISIEMDDDGLLPQKIITIFEERIKNRDSLPRVLKKMLSCFLNI